LSAGKPADSDEGAGGVLSVARAAGRLVAEAALDGSAVAGTDVSDEASRGGAKFLGLAGCHEILCDAEWVA